MNIICTPTGPLGTNTYIIYNEEGTEVSPAPCAVVDPASSKKVLDLLLKHHLHCSDILLTHGHFDHIMGVAELKEKHSAKVLIHELDANALTGGAGSLAYMGGILVKKCSVDVLLRDEDVITAAGFPFRVIHTPGHTPGGVCFVSEEERVIFSGDTLFRLSVGRTDLPGGDSEQLFESIAYRLFTLHGDFRVLPGHEDETTLDFEREHNPYVRGGMF
ncbi:MAG: MBL fold metallo-hydrolase [Clostridia bacterium]|nr:MBL fold metallo-hydrolase [Clostridia bacterium]